MRLYRIVIDKHKFGRNAYNDLYHWTARYSFLEKLLDEGREMYNIVYVDPDVLIMSDLHGVFERDFDYSVTISENHEQPINGAMHFVPKGRYPEVNSSLMHTCKPYGEALMHRAAHEKQRHQDAVQEVEHWSCAGIGRPECWIWHASTLCLLPLSLL